MDAIEEETLLRPNESLVAGRRHRRRPHAHRAHRQLNRLSLERFSDAFTRISATGARTACSAASAAGALRSVSCRSSRRSRPNGVDRVQTDEIDMSRAALRSSPSPPAGPHDQQLSGGERNLTAVAMLMSISQQAPCFCVSTGGRRPDEGNSPASSPPSDSPTSPTSSSSPTTAAHAGRRPALRRDDAERGVSSA